MLDRSPLTAPKGGIGVRVPWAEPLNGRAAP